MPEHSLHWTTGLSGAGTVFAFEASGALVGTPVGAPVTVDHTGRVAPAGPGDVYGVLLKLDQDGTCLVQVGGRVTLQLGYGDEAPFPVPPGTTAVAIPHAPAPVLLSAAVGETITLAVPAREPPAPPERPVWVARAWKRVEGQP